VNSLLIAHSYMSDTRPNCLIHNEILAVYRARERNGQVGQLPYQLWDWYGKLYILPYQYFVTAYC